MVALVSFDGQAHDTYFIVAHLHYVLIGGMVFPLFAALYYWVPFVSTRPLSERTARWVFGLMFVGVNVAFFPMHITGLAGMPRRVYTYSADLGWDTLNLVSTIGAFMIAAGVALFLIDLARNFRFAIEHHAGNVWNAGTLEWLPTGAYGTRSIPKVTSREPLWDQPGLAEEVEAGGHYLPGAPTGGLETIVGSPLDARPQYLLQLTGPSWMPIGAAAFTAAFFLLLTLKQVPPAIVCGAIALAMIVRWMWDTDRGPYAPAGRHRRRDHSTRVHGGTGLAFVVGDGRPHPGRDRDLRGARVLVPGSVDGVGQALAGTPCDATARLSARSGRVAGARRRCDRSCSRALDKDAQRSMGGALVMALVALCAAFGIDLYAMLQPNSASPIELRRRGVHDCCDAGALCVGRRNDGALHAGPSGSRTSRSRAPGHIRQYDAARVLHGGAGAIGLALVHGFPRLVA